MRQVLTTSLSVSRRDLCCPRVYRDNCPRAIDRDFAARMLFQLVPFSIVLPTFILTIVLVFSLLVDMAFATLGIVLCLYLAKRTESFATFSTRCLG